MAEDLSATVPFCTPERVTLAELERRQQEDAQRASAPSRIPATPPASIAPALPPDCSQPNCPLRKELILQRQQAGYWKNLHHRARQREERLKTRIAELEAQLRLREQQLFGRKTESASCRDSSPSNVPPDHPAPDAPPKVKPTPRSRGQQPGQPGHPRRQHAHLPTVEETIDLPCEQQQCSQCGLPFAPFPGTEDVSILEIEVRPYRRVCHRRRYRRTCCCGCHPQIITAPTPPRLIPKSTLGVSLWVTVLLDKFLYHRPTYRLLADWRTQGLDLPQGTLTDGLQSFLPFFQPLYDRLAQRQQQQKHWHADETRWYLFVTSAGKVGHRWYFWAFRSEGVVVFVLSPGRDHEVPESYFQDVKEGILNVDRYSAYKAMAQVKAGLIILAFCWAHVRRDFLKVARSWPEQEGWALEWVERIGELYQRNKTRLAVQEDPLAFATRDQELRAWVAKMAEQRQQELAEPKLHPARRKVLESLTEHWSGLTVFVEHPHVPMDNNPVERDQRGPVVGRKNYYGSGALWSGELAVMLFSLLGTLQLWGLNPRLWLTAYLNACATAGGQAPANVEAWLPWNLSAEQRRAWTLESEAEPEVTNSS